MRSRQAPFYLYFFNLICVESPSRALLFCKNIGPFYDLSGMTFCEEDLYFCKREVQAPLKPLME